MAKAMLQVASHAVHWLGSKILSIAAKRVKGRKSVSHDPLWDMELCLFFTYNVAAEERNQHSPIADTIVISNHH